MGLISEQLAAAATALVGRGGLPDVLPADPMPMFGEWFEEARASGKYDDPNAMVLATVSADGAPSARVVLCKQIETARAAGDSASGRAAIGGGAIVFFTNYQSRKGEELDANPHAATVFHWPHRQRQVRIEGRVERLDAAASDEYFASRPLLSKLGAWVSQQSRPLERRSDLVERVAKEAARHGVDLLTSGGAHIPRPAHWGGFRLIIGRIELWQGVQGRLHDRAVWVRTGDGWSAQRLQP